MSYAPLVVGIATTFASSDAFALQTTEKVPDTGNFICGYSNYFASTAIGRQTLGKGWRDLVGVLLREARR